MSPLLAHQRKGRLKWRKGGTRVLKEDRISLLF